MGKICGNKKIGWLSMAVLLLFLSLSYINLYAAEATDGLITDQGDGTFLIDAGITNPDDYQNIVGFNVTFKVTEGGLYGGGMPVNLLIFARGKLDAEDFEVTYDEGTGFPVYVNDVSEIAVMGSGEASFLSTTFFLNGVDVGALETGECITASYEGTKALFSEECSMITAYAFAGKFEIETIEWIVGSPESDEEQIVLDWKPVETTVYEDVQTVENGTEANYIDITIPAEGEGPFPVILWIHGGGWASYDRKSCIISDTKEYLLSQGYAFVSAEYTLCKRGEDGASVVESGYPQMIYDLKAAVRFLRAHAEEYRLDTRFIAAMGESAGAHLAMLLGTTNGSAQHEDLNMGNEDYSSDVQAMVSYFGPTIFTGEDHAIFAYAMLGDLASDGGDEAAKLKELMGPYHQINADSPALFMVHGENDDTVPVEHSKLMEERASQFLDGEDLIAIYLENGPHGNKAAFDQEFIMARLSEFLDSQASKYIENEQDQTMENTEEPDSMSTETGVETDTKEQGSITDIAEQDNTTTNNTEEHAKGGMVVVVAVAVLLVVIAFVYIRKKKVG